MRPWPSPWWSTARRVLVVEREKRFKDRIRGEFLAPWGVAEARALGTYEHLRAGCACECPRLGFYTEPEFGEPRDLITTTPQKLPALAFYHPAMQEVLLQAAAEAGAEIRRGAHVRDVRPGDVPSVAVEQDGRIVESRRDWWWALMDVTQWSASGRALLFSTTQSG